MMPLTTAKLVMFTMVSCLMSPAIAWVIPPDVGQSKIAPKLYYSHDSNNGDNEKTTQDRVLDDIRRSQQDLTSRDLPCAPHTSMARERLQAEIKLLESLQHSNAAVMELTNLWNSGGYGGSQNSFKSMMKVEMAISMGHAMGGDEWADAQLRLEELILEHDMKWLEPIFKLGYLYHLQDRLQDAQDVYRYVLDRKPWHIGAINGLIAVSSDTDEIDYWSSKVLPPLTLNTYEELQCRKIWVNEMVGFASQQLSGDYVIPSRTDSILSASHPETVMLNTGVLTTSFAFSNSTTGMFECWQ